MTQSSFHTKGETPGNPTEAGTKVVGLETSQDTDGSREERYCKCTGFVEDSIIEGVCCKCAENSLDTLGTSISELTVDERRLHEVPVLNGTELESRPDVVSSFQNEHKLDRVGMVPECAGSGLSMSTVSSLSIESLPPEILLKIFSFLQPVELCRHVTRVCKQWHTLAYDHSLWHRLDLSRVHLPLTGFDICRIVQRVGSSIHQLNLHALDCLTPAEMAVIAESCPELTHLDLGFVSGVNPVMVHSILSSCHRLHHINVEGCKDVHHEFVRVMVSVAQSALCHLNFSHCPLVDDSLLLLSARLSKIVALNIDGISWISDRTVRDLAEKHKGSLESLELDGAELTDYAIAALVPCQRLTFLSISFCELLSDNSLSYIQTLPSLRRLCLRKGVMFSSEGLTKFLSSPSLSSLSHLDLSECASLRDVGVQALVRCALVNLYLVGLHRLTGSCLDRVPEDMPSLRRLDLQQCNLIQDPLVEDVVRRKPDLVVINYYGEMFVHGPQD
ncbi:hypothetical protein BaRGS_00004942 [Batillaria attramentaria]|uniref:F-box domain-containing protein n=1 Tax=Batillaria attramentaria TaxID=370345 RepID=A0ABD0LW38_9CAEN